jgi:hypothetical protein
MMKNSLSALWMIFKMIVDRVGCFGVDDCLCWKGAPIKLMVDLTGNDGAGLTLGSVIS